MVDAGCFREGTVNPEKPFMFYTSFNGLKPSPKTSLASNTVINACSSISFMQLSSITSSLQFTVVKTIFFLIPGKKGIEYFPCNEYNNPGIQRYSPVTGCYQTNRQSLKRSCSLLDEQGSKSKR
jgi:hypothetical protein